MKCGRRGPQRLRCADGASSLRAQVDRPQVTFQGTFSSHPLQGGHVAGGLFPAASGPFVPVTDTGTSATFTMTAAGTFPYYCTAHALIGMTGAVFVVP